MTVPDPEAVDAVSEGSGFDSLTPYQIEVLCNVAFGGQGAACRPQTLYLLEQRGLIEACVHRERVGSLSYSWTRYEMPVGVHIDFCEWCARNFPGPEDLR